jgi:hypothetical protein
MDRDLGSLGADFRLLRAVRKEKYMKEIQPKEIRAIEQFEVFFARKPLDSYRRQQDLPIARPLDVVRAELLQETIKAAHRQRAQWEKETK